jgi:hypothetical protein
LAQATTSLFQTINSFRALFTKLNQSFADNFIARLKDKAMDREIKNENRLTGEDPKSPVLNHRPWVFIHNTEDWENYKQRTVPPDIKWCSNHEPEEPLSYPCLVETSVIDWTCHHRFVYLEDAYRLLLGINKALRPAWMPS